MKRDKIEKMKKIKKMKRYFYFFQWIWREIGLRRWKR